MSWKANHGTQVIKPEVLCWVGFY